MGTVEKKPRRTYYKHIFGRTWGEKENYELDIDSSCGVEKAVDMIIEYLAKRNRYSAIQYNA